MKTWQTGIMVAKKMRSTKMVKTWQIGASCEYNALSIAAPLGSIQLLSLLSAVLLVRIAHAFTQLSARHCSSFHGLKLITFPKFSSCLGGTFFASFSSTLCIFPSILYCG